MTYGYPITEYQGVSAGVSLQRLDLLTFAAQQRAAGRDWVRANGHPYSGPSVTTSIEPDGTTIATSTALPGSRFNTLELSAGWQYDSRNRALFADRGLRSALSLTYVPPGARRALLIGSYQFSGYLPVWRQFVAVGELQFAYGKGIGGTTGLPPYKRFYAGGPDTVRGYTEDTLGPVDTNGNPYGGNMLTVSRTELLLPVPEKWQTSARVSVFYDMGNVFSNDGTKFLGEDLQTPINYNFSYHALRIRPACRCSGWRRRWVFSASATASHSIRSEATTSTFRTILKASSSRSGSRSSQEQA